MKLLPSVSGDLLRRTGWFLLALLFVVTGLGVGVYAFWQSTHTSDTSQSQSQTAESNCAFSGSVSSQTLPAPASYKPDPVPTGLVKTDLKVGSGAAAKAGDCVVAKYYGTLVDGTVFDQDYNTPNALQFLLGQGEVIPGWDQGLIGMKPGGERRLIIPPALGYGSQAQGSIPANSTLVFDVTLISIK